MSIFGFNSLHEWMEEFSLRTDQGVIRAQRRWARRLGRVYHRVKKETGKLEAVLNKTTHGERLLDEEIRDSYEHYLKAMLATISLTQKIIIEYKVLMARRLNDLEQFESDVALMHPPNPELVETAQKIQKVAQDTINAFLQRLTSFGSIQLTANQIIDEASQIRTIYYQVREARKEDKRFKYRLLEVEKDARKQYITPKSVKTAKQALKEFEKLIKDESAAIGTALFLLREMLKEMQKQQAKLQKMPKATGMPPKWVERHDRQIEEVEGQINEWVEKQVDKGRIFLSEAIHKSQSVKLK